MFPSVSTSNLFCVQFHSTFPYYSIQSNSTFRIFFSFPWRRNLCTVRWISGGYYYPIRWIFSERNMGFASCFRKLSHNNFSRPLIAFLLWKKQEDKWSDWERIYWPSPDTDSNIFDDKIYWLSARGFGISGLNLWSLTCCERNGLSIMVNYIF